MAAMSSLMVLKGWSLMGDAMSHAVLPGIVLAFVAGLPLAVGAFGAGLFLRGRHRLAFGQQPGEGGHGDGHRLLRHVRPRASCCISASARACISTISCLATCSASPGPTWERPPLLALLCGGFLVLKWRDLVAQAFDELHARAIGLRTGWLHYGLLTAIALMIVASLKAVGIILSIALLVAPGAIAFLVARTFAGMLTVAVGSVVLSALTGIFASYHINSEPAPTMVLCLTGFFIAALVVGQVRDFRMRRLATSEETTPAGSDRALQSQPGRSR
jgi:manganese/iron transport system permease protein